MHLAIRGVSKKYSSGVQALRDVSLTIPLWREGMATLDDPGGSARFRFRKGEQVQSARGRGQIRQGYASGAIVQYEIETEDGRLLMVDEADLSGPAG